MQFWTLHQATHKASKNWEIKMLKRHITLNFFSSNTPWELIITTCDGCFIVQKTINSNFYTLCLCTDECCVKVSAKFGDQVITKSILLSDCMCKSYDTNFNFVLPAPIDPVLQVIMLVDANYGLPVRESTLNFKN